MGSGISLATKRVIYTMAGVFQLACYIAFLFSPAENMISKGRKAIFFIILLLLSLGLALLAANTKTSDCELDSCSNKINQITMTTCSSITTILIAVLFKFEFMEKSKIGMAIAALGLIVLGLFWTMYAFDFRGIICMCDNVDLTVANCRAALPDCTINCN